MLFCRDNDALSKSKLDDAVKKMAPSVKRFAVQVFWEYVPYDKDLDVDAQLKYIICAMPCIGRRSANSIAAMLAAETLRKASTETYNPRNCAWSLPYLARRARAEYPELAEQATDRMAAYKHIPDEIKNDRTYMLQLAVASAIGSMAGNYGAPTECLEYAAGAVTGHRLRIIMQEFMKNGTNNS